MMTDYAGRRVIVTGCASGIGAAVATGLAALGAEVVGIDRNPAAVPPARFVAADLGDRQAIDDAVAAIGGRVDALFNCVGLPPTRPGIDIMRVNFLGVRHLTARVAGLMGEGGAIVSVSSNGGMRWRQRLPLLRAFLATDTFEDGLAWIEPRLDSLGNAYGFTKEALITWTMAESARLIARGIRINCTSPGAVSTPMLTEIETSVPAAAIDATARPIGRRSSSAEQAAPLLFLNSPAASYVNGIDLAVDGGFAAMVALTPPPGE